jgi:hypothetical protein
MILDSNIVIYSNQPKYENLLTYLDAYKRNLQVSLITQLEVLGFHQLSLQDKADFEAFFASVSVLPLDEKIITEAIRLRQQRKRSLADSIIAATGLLYNQPVLTNNVADFVDINGL